jgi:hypothetical protein
MSDDTPILSLPLILPAQAQKHVTHNEALRLLDVLVQLAVTDRTRITPPATPVEGDRHIIATGATGPWADRDGQVACFWGGAWLYLVPQAGWTARVVAEALTVVWQGGAWANAVSPPPPPVMLGINATADTTNRLTVSAPATLLTHEGAGHQVKINKSLPADTASLLFQSGWQGRAEMGLTGSDAFAIKVSADGSQWHTALTTDPASGSLSLPAPLQLGAQAAAPVAPANGSLWLDPTGEVRVASAGAVHRVGLAPQANFDFCAVTRFGAAAASTGPFAGTAIGSGSNTTQVPAAAVLGTNPFGVFLRSSATANSGFRYTTAPSSDIFGVTTRKFRAKCLWRASASTTVRLGFHNCTTVADSDNGGYFEVIGDQITAKTAAASVRSTHATALTLALNTVYTFDIEVAAPATAARFRVWENSTPTPVLDVQLTTNLPTVSANAFGAGVIATNALTTATDMIILYELAVGTIAGFRRLLD